MINYKAIIAIYFHEIERTKRTIFQSIISPIITTSLYFIIFGSAIGSRIKEIDGVSYGMYIVPGLLMLNLLTQSISNGSFSTFFPKFNGTIYELQAAPISGIEMILGFVGATASKSLLLGTLIIIIPSLLIFDYLRAFHRSKAVNPDTGIKNPTITKEEYEKNSKLHGLKSYDSDNGDIKLSAGEMLDKLELKGLQLRNIGLSNMHALILINNGICTANDVKHVENYLLNKVSDSYGITLEREPIYL